MQRIFCINRQQQQKKEKENNDTIYITERIKHAIPFYLFFKGLQFDKRKSSVKYESSTYFKRYGNICICFNYVLQII